VIVRKQKKVTNPYTVMFDLEARRLADYLLGSVQLNPPEELLVDLKLARLQELNWRKKQ